MQGISALEMLRTNQEQRLGFGCPHFDRLLRGGLTCRGINEISGEAGTGKTNLCLQLCLQVQLSVEQGGLNGSAVYITSEDLPTKRLHQMAAAFKQRHPAAWLGKRSPLDSIFVERAESLSDQEHCLSTRIPVLLQRSNVKLVVLDSIASLFRSEFESDEYLNRSRSISQHAELLQKLSLQFGAVVVVTNQVTDVFDLQQLNQCDAMSRGRAVRPSLGLSWGHKVFERFMLSRAADTEGAIASSMQVRNLQVQFAPHIPPDSCRFTITTDGVFGE